MAPFGRPLTAASWIDAGDLLYFDSQDGNRLKVGVWGKDVNLGNVIFTQFGSTVGFTMVNNNDTWDSGDIKFNPTSTASSTWGTPSSYPNIPHYTGTDYTDGYVSTSAYHYRANVQAGRGDICKLVGYTAAEVKAWTDTTFPANPTWRLPTNAENYAFASVGDGKYSWTIDSSTTLGVGTFPSGLSLPALGARRDTDGSVIVWGIHGEFWSSTANSSLNGRSLHFKQFDYSATNTYGRTGGFPVRCVKAN